MTVLHQAIDSVTGEDFQWAAVSYDHGAGYPGPNSPTNILVLAGIGPGRCLDGGTGATGPTGCTGATGATGDAGSTSWHTLLDIDFTSATSQTFSADTTYTVGGYTATKVGSAQEQYHCQIANGTGLVLYQTAGTDALAYNAPQLRFALSQFTALAGRYDVPLRFLVEVGATNYTYNLQAHLVVGFSSAATSSSDQAFNMLGLFDAGSASLTSWCGVSCIFGSTGGYASPEASGTALSPAPDTFGALYSEGVGENCQVRFVASKTSGVFDSWDDNAISLGSNVPSASTNDPAVYNSYASTGLTENWCLRIGASKFQAGQYSTVVKRLQIQARY